MAARSVERIEDSLGCYFERYRHLKNNALADCSTFKGRTVEITFRIHRQFPKVIRLLTSPAAGKREQTSFRPTYARCNPEERAARQSLSTVYGRAVEISQAILNQTAGRLISVEGTPEIVKNLLRPARSGRRQFIHRAASVAVVVSSPGCGCAEEITSGVQEKTAQGALPSDVPPLKL